MAASGINEHNEARRKHNVLLKKAAFYKHAQSEGLMDCHQERYGQQTQPAPQSYYEQLMAMKRKQEEKRIMEQHANSKESVDRQRRDLHRRDMEDQYSAKLSNRFTSSNYTAQW